MSQNKWPILFLSLCVCSVPISANAQAEQSPDQQSFQALLRQGFQQYQKKQYDAAILSWKDAYAKEPQAFLHHSIAKAYEKQGKLKEAMNAALLARDQKDRPLSAKLSAKNERLISSLQVAMKKQEAAQRAEAERLRKLREARMYTNQRVTWLTYAGAGSVTTGAILMGVGAGYFGGQARRKIDALEDPNQPYPDRGYNAETTDISRLQNQGRVLLFTGIGLTAIGSALLVWDLTTTERVIRDDYDATKTSALQLQLSPQYAEVTWRF